MSVNSEKRENWEGEPKNNEESCQDGQLVGNSDEVVDDFDNMSLKEELLRGIYAYGIERPSAIQQRAIIPCIKGHDVAIQAQSGTGKTVAFSISILQQINTTIRECQALILVLTRERALQIQEVVVTLGDFMGAVCHACVGGTDVREDVRKLKMGVHVLVGTPGRVFDMIRRRALKTNTIKIFVLDKADLISSRGFKDQIHDVFKTLPQEVQLVLLSAATPKYIIEATNFFMRQPKNFDMITIEPSNFGSYGLTPGELPANCKEKFETYNPSQFVDEGEENDDVEVMQGGGYKISFHVAKEFFAGIIGRQGSTRRQLEKETRTIITIPKTGQDGDIVVTGCVKNSVLSAKQRIEMIVLSMRKRQTYTHFVSLPFTNQSFKTGFLNFKTEVLEHCKARGIDETIFQNPDKLHLTVCVMALMDGVERKKAAGALFECKKHVIKPLLLNNPLEVEMVGVACMNDNPSKVDILYGKVKSNPNILQDLANGVLDYFVGKGLVWRQRDHVKLHVTLMNSKFRKRGEATDDRVKPETFDASQILRDYADFVFGAAVITQIELLLMPSVSDSESGYYRATATMPIP